MRKLLCLALSMSVLCGAGNAFALGYKQHLDNKATFETLKEAHVNGPAYLGPVTKRTYVPDPALDSYPDGTTYVYRSANMFTCLSAANRMNTNILVFTDQSFDSKDAALAYIKNLGLTDIVDKAYGSVVLVTPIDKKAGYGVADQFAYYQMQSAMYNIGFAKRNEDKTTNYYADSAYFGGQTYRYLIGIDGGATFLNDYVATTFDYISRVAGMLLVNGRMEKVRKVAYSVPVYLAGTTEEIVGKYKEANATNASGRERGYEYFFNQAHSLQKVIVSQDAKLGADFVKDVYANFFSKIMRVPVLKAGLYTASTPYANYNWNQAPYSLGERNAIVDGRTRDGINVVEHNDERFKSIATSAGEYIQTWYEFLPDEVLKGTATKGSVPLILMNHGGGDDPVQAADDLGWITLAGKKHFAMVAAHHTSATDVLSSALPALVKYMLDTYPQLDRSRVYVTGYSMGGGATNRTLYGDASLFAAAVPMSGTPYTHLPNQTAQFASIDIPVLFTTCTYDTITHFDVPNGRIAEDFQMNINDYLGYNEMPTVTYDFKTYPMSGFKGDAYKAIMLNDEYPNYTWMFINKAGVPMIGLSITEFLPHGLYQAYAELAWNFMVHYSRNVTTKAIGYNAYAN
jgi:dienelactone hydrolase